MGAFLGCCVIAGMIWYVGRKIARVLFVMCGFIETYGQRRLENWPSREEFERAFRE